MPIQGALISFPTVLGKDNDNAETLKFWVFPPLFLHTRKVSHVRGVLISEEFKYCLELEEISPFD